MATIEIRVDGNLEKLEAQLASWKAKLDEAKVESRERIDELKARLDDARVKLDEAKAAGTEKWASLKDGVERMWSELTATFEKIVH